MLGTLDVVSIYIWLICFTKDQRTAKCEKNKQTKSDALASFLMTVVDTGAPENQDFFESWLQEGMTLQLGRK